MFDLTRKICIASVVLATLFFTSCIKDKVESSDDTTLVGIGQAAPDFTVDMLDGDKVTLSDLRGDVVLLTFWDPECPTCQKQMDVAEERIVKRLQDKSVHYLPISRGYTREYISDYCLSRGYDFPIGLDPQKRIYGLYATKYVPRSFVIDRKGIIRHIYVEYELDALDTILTAAEQLAK